MRVCVHQGQWDPPRGLTLGFGHLPWLEVPSPVPSLEGGLGWMEGVTSPFVNMSIPM